MTDHPIQSPAPPHFGIGVSLVDGDPVIRRARQIMLLSERYDVRSYATGAALLADPRSRDVPCIVVDVAGGVDGDGGSGMDTLYAMRASGWRGRRSCSTAPSRPRADPRRRTPRRPHPRPHHRRRPLLTAIAASIDHGWSTWNAEG
ncbi:hypothetical protein [Sphingomonas sp. LR55]|uniref:hypothetical protein n=1 Tax=Sphingomonas sp. LR55 TaxID=3050231 RepID=UPI002FDF271F